MAVANGSSVKLAQEINMPDAVIAMNIFYFHADFQEEQTDEDVVATLEPWVEGVYDTIAAVLSDEVSLGDMTVYKYNSITDQWDNLGSAAPTKVGTEASGMLPHGVAGLVRAYSVNPRSIARKYIPGLSEADQDDGTWGGATITALAAFGSAWSAQATISANNRLRSAVFDTKLKITRQLTGTEVVLANPAYQRRRRPGVGM